MKKEVKLYAGFERIWHWLQALFIISMLITGLEIRGIFQLFGFESALKYHYVAAILLLVLTIFAIFWHFTTGTWKHYIPTTENLMGQIKYYISGCNSEVSRPSKKTELSKLNPIQRLTYLGLKLFIIPFMLITGLVLVMYTYNHKEVNLELYSTLHAIGAYMMILFVVVHVYMTTTGHTIFSNLIAMITGKEEIEVESEK